MVRELRSNLPPKMESQRCMGAWKSTRWTDGELSQAFRTPLTLLHESTRSIEAAEDHVPVTLAEAVRRGYAKSVDTRPSVSFW
jgi:hypothetical protein